MLQHKNDNLQLNVNQKDQWKNKGRWQCLLKKKNFIRSEMKDLDTGFGSKHQDYNISVTHSCIPGCFTAHFHSTSDHKIIVQLNSELGPSR